MAVGGSDAASSALARPEGHFYNARFPKENDVVMIQVRRVEETGAYVSLLEYNGHEGFMPMAELSRRRVRSLGKLLRVGRSEVLAVMRVDEERGYIDLSKRRVDPEDLRRKQEDFAKAKVVHGMMRHVAETCELELEDLLCKLSWPLYGSKFGNPFDAYVKHINGDVDIWTHLQLTTPGADLSHNADKIREVLEEDLRHKLLTQPLRLQARVDVACDEYEGIEAVQAALRAGLVASRDGVLVSCRLLSHPSFALSCVCRDGLLAKSVLQEAMSAIEESIGEAGGSFAVAQPLTVLRGDTREEKEGTSSSEESVGVGQRPRRSRINWGHELFLARF